MSDIAFQQSESHADEDENYFVSMTDMMVGILFIFIILLMVFALNFRQQTEKSEDQIKKLETAAEAAQSVNAKLREIQKDVRSEIDSISAADRVRTELLEEIQAKLKDQGLIVTIDPVSGVVRLGDNAINFPRRVAALDDVASQRVAILARVLADVLPKYTGTAGDLPAHLETVFIEGHTDSTGVDRDNWTLSTERAVNTFRGLSEAEPSLRTLLNSADTEVLSVAGYASTRPIRDFSDDDGRQRRIDLRFVMDTNNLERLRGVLELTDTMKSQLEFLQKSLDDVSVH
ncbi:OmpA family protein [Mesorhizobium sp. M0408]|uniref:OmpA/MotB family protein n=1 Tax=Mesorhizobium sp. M0408 TaxID=2956942 RepID=UPI0033371B95